MREKRLGDKGVGGRREDVADMGPTEIYHARRYVRVGRDMGGGKNVRRLCKFLMANALLAASPALAADTVSTANPPHTVTCVYDAVPLEMRTVVYDLVETVAARSSNPLDDPDVRLAISGQIAAAHERCLDLYPLSAGESETSNDFALISLVSDVLGRRMKENGNDIRAIDRYFAVNRSRLSLPRIPTAAELAATKASLPANLPPRARDDLARSILARQARKPTKPEAAALIVNLKAQGWKFDTPQAELLAEGYLAMQIQLAFDRRAYANGGYGR